MKIKISYFDQLSKYSIMIEDTLTFSTCLDKY